MRPNLSLRFLADESCDFAVVRALRAEGCDVVTVSEYMQRSDDRVLIIQAGEEQRVFLTEDKDFGWLVFASHETSAGVILIRYPGDARQELADDMVQLMYEQGESLLGAFVVIQPGHVRIRRLPLRVT